MISVGIKGLGVEGIYWRMFYLDRGGLERNVREVFLGKGDIGLSFERYMVFLLGMVF